VDGQSLEGASYDPAYADHREVIRDHCLGRHNGRLAGNADPDTRAWLADFEVCGSCSHPVAMMAQLRAAREEFRYRADYNPNGAPHAEDMVALCFKLEAAICHGHETGSPLVESTYWV
jgi:hypothetical protein